MTKNERFKILKKALKLVLITGATVCLMATSLVGCVIHSLLSDNTPTTSKPESSYTEIYEEEDKGPIVDFNEIAGESLNYRLYASEYNSLSSVIPTDAFGMLSSKNNNNADRRLERGEYQGIDINLTKESYNTYAKWVNSKDVTYVYADLYDINRIMDYIDDYDNEVLAQNHQHTDLITSIDKIPTPLEIENVIVKNTNNFMRNNNGYYAVDGTYVKMISNIFVGIITEYHDELSEEDLTRLYCMLNDIVLVGIDSMDFTVNDLKTGYNARVTEDGVIMLDIEQMKNIRGENTIERTLAHEIIHIFQRMCKDHQIKGMTQIGNSQYVEQAEKDGYANSLHFQWLYEAGAEKMSMELYDADSPLVYKNMVGYLNTLDLITLIRPGYEEDSIELSQLSTNPSAIYEVFGAKTNEEKEEIAHMLFSICYIQTDREDFVTIYEKTHGEINGQETTVKRIMKDSVVKTMTKYFYRNLAERVANADVTLQDAFYLINVFESSLSGHLIYDDASRYELNESAINFYVEIQNEFFKYIAQDSGFTYDDIVKQFGEFALVIKNEGIYSRNNSFTWLSEEEKEFVGKVLTTNISNVTINIRDAQIENSSYTK